MSCHVCGQMSVTGGLCQISVPSKGDRCRHHPKYHPRQAPPRQPILESLPVTNKPDVLVVEVEQALERMQADLSVATRALGDLKRRLR